MIFSRALGEMDLDGVFDELVTIEEFLHNKGGDCLKDAVFHVFMDTDTTEEEKEIAIGLRAGIDEYYIDSFVKQAKIKYIEEELKGEVANSFICEIKNILDTWFRGSVEFYLGDDGGTDLIKFNEVMDGELNERVYNNYKQHMGRVIKNKKKMYVDFADAKEFTHLYIDVDHRKLKVEDDPRGDDPVNYREVSRKEFIETLEENMFPEVRAYEVACYDVLEGATGALIEDMKYESSLWEQYYVDIVDNFDFKEEEERKESENIPKELMEPMEQLTMVAA